MDKQTVKSLHEVGNDKVKRMLEDKFPEYFDIGKDRDEWFISVLKGLIVRDVNPHFIVFENKEEQSMIYVYEGGNCDVSSERIWKILNKKFKMGYFVIQKYIIHMLKEYFKYNNIKNVHPFT